MKPVLLFLLALLAACSPAPAPRLQVVVDGTVHHLAASDLSPAHLLAQAGIPYSLDDRLLLNGSPVPIDVPLPSQAPLILDLQRARPIQIVTPSQTFPLTTAAATVGEALRSLGIELYLGDRVEPPPETPLTPGMTITITPGRELVLHAGPRTLRIRTAASTVGQALAEAGIPLIGADHAVPSEDEPLPADGQVRLIRVSESIESEYVFLPIQTERIVSSKLTPPAQEVIDPGEVGVILRRTRIRYHDGVEIARLTESEVTLRPARSRQVLSSFWAAKEMYATSYSPCRSGISGCSYGTASGMRVQHGVVAVNLEWYLALKGVRVYVPGYGIGVIADVCPGCKGKPWIDLGYSDENYVPWSSWVTVYFLPPEPAVIPWFLR